MVGVEDTSEVGPLAKESITLDILLGHQPEQVHFPIEPIYEDIIQGSAAQSERVRIARNARLTINLENRWQRQSEIGITCDDKLWNKAD